MKPLEQRARPTVRALTGRDLVDTTWPPCSVRGCVSRAEYLIGLPVVTHGREGLREEFRCVAHASTFAQRKGLRLPPGIA